MACCRDINVSFTCLSTVALSATAAMKQFGKVYYQHAELSYKKHNGKLPGCSKTRRLKKKRIKEVVEWYGKILNQYKIANQNR